MHPRLEISDLGDAKFGLLMTGQLSDSTPCQACYGKSLKATNLYRRDSVTLLLRYPLSKVNRDLEFNCPTSFSTER